MKTGERITMFIYNHLTYKQYTIVNKLHKVVSLFLRYLDHKIKSRNFFIYNICNRVFLSLNFRLLLKMF